MKNLILSFLLGAFLKTGAQIYNAGTMFSIYYDITPDTLLNYVSTPYTNETFSLNLFGDASNDIELSAHGAVSSGGSSDYLRVRSLNPNVFIMFGRWDSVFVIADSNWDITKVAKPLNYGDPINPLNAVWESSTLYLTDHSGHGGGNKNVNDWIGGDKYLALKYTGQSPPNYGWLRVRCTTEDSCYVKDLSHTPVTTGTIATGISETSPSETMVWPNPSTGIFYLKNIDISSFDESRLRLTDLIGRNVEFAFEVKEGDIKIEISSARGCYFLHYFSEGSRLTKKLIILSE
jgi:hypothetical protein